jgi:hypothetical protein
MLEKGKENGSRGVRPHGILAVVAKYFGPKPEDMKDRK